MKKISIEKKFWDYIDFKLLIPVLLLTGIGFISIYSATASLPNNKQFENQIFAFGISFIIMLFFALTPEKWLHYLSIPIYGIVVVLLIATLLFGTTIFGTRGWLIIGGRSFQASEFAKLATLMAFAFIFSNVNVSIKYLQTFLIVIGTFLLPTALILLQPDVGTATVFFAMLLGILYWSGFNIFAIYTILSLPILLLLALKGGIFPWIGLGIFVIIALFFKRKLLSTIIAIGLSLIVVFSAPIVYQNLQPHQKARISTFLDPNSNKKDTGYNVAQSVLAVGSGGIAGKGFMQGTQTQLRYIPMQSTDFIFSVPAEEFGLIGSIIVLGLLFYLFLRIFKLATEVKSRFYSVIIFGGGCILLYHTLMNIGMVLGLLPAMGIPLPFMSAGGSALMTNYAIIGLMLNAYRSNI